MRFSPPNENAILAKRESPEDVRRLLEQMQREQPQRELSVLWLGERRGELMGVTALVTARVRWGRG